LSEVAKFVIEQNSPMEALVTHTFGLDHAQTAYDLFVSGETGKVILTM
jgi:threonine dehydrogenase-like Zn-dependent dehydrogenase